MYQGIVERQDAIFLDAADGRCFTGAAFLVDNGDVVGHWFPPSNCEKVRVSLESPYPKCNQALRIAC